MYFQFFDALVVYINNNSFWTWHSNRHFSIKHKCLFKIYLEGEKKYIYIWIRFNSRDSYWNRLIAIDRSEFNELAIK
jgi:hypothetical protein